jgi:hypothetical protein
MNKLIDIGSARRCISARRSQRPLARRARLCEMRICHLEATESQQEEELITTIIRAIDSAKSCRSNATVQLLKIALLNEGVRIADGLREDTHLRQVEMNHLV